MLLMVGVVIWWRDKYKQRTRYLKVSWGVLKIIFIRSKTNFSFQFIASDVQYGMSITFTCFLLNVTYGHYGWHSLAKVQEIQSYLRLESFPQKRFLRTFAWKSSKVQNLLKHLWELDYGNLMPEMHNNNKMGVTTLVLEISCVVDHWYYVVKKLPRYDESDMCYMHRKELCINNSCECP